MTLTVQHKMFIDYTNGEPCGIGRATKAKVQVSLVPATLSPGIGSIPHVS